MKNPHEGLHSDRLYPNRDNPKEVAFAEQWKEENKEIGIGFIMRYLVPNYSQRDAEVAATVIQWLGSQCGQSFLEEVEKKIRNLTK